MQVKASCGDLVAWTVDEDSVIGELELDPGDVQLLREKTGSIVEAVLSLARMSPVAEPKAKRRAAAVAPLFVPGSKYHLNVSRLMKSLAIGSIRVVAQAYILQRLHLCDFVVTFAGMGLVELVQRVSQLDGDQRALMEALYRTKRSSGVPAYWPSTDEVAAEAGVSPVDVRKALTPLVGRVLAFQPETDSWRIEF